MKLGKGSELRFQAKMLERLNLGESLEMTFTHKRVVR